MEISTTEFFWEEAPPEFGKDRRHCKREKHKFSHIKRKPGLPRLTLRATLSRKRKLHQFFLGNHDCMLKKHTVHQKFGRKISWKGQHAFIGEHTIYLQEECQCEKVFQRTQQFFYKIENNIFFKFLFLFPLTQSFIFGKSPIGIVLVESRSTYKQNPVLITSRVPLGLCQCPIKAGHFSLSIYQFFREFFRDPFMHLSRGIFQNLSYTRLAYIMYPR